MKNLVLKTVIAALKDAFFLLIYVFVMGILAMFTLLVKNDGLKAFLFVLILLFFAFIIIIFVKSAGERQYKTLISGNIRRKSGVTPESEKYLKPHEEYKLYKGFLIGALAFLPLYVMLIINVIVPGSLDTAVKFLYVLLWAPISAINTNLSIFLTVPLSLVFVATSGFGYYLGGKKIKNQQKKVNDIHKMIYGKDLDK